MGLMCCTCCCCRRKNKISENPDMLPTNKYKVVLLGLPLSGKTEVGHLLSGLPRTTYEPTNGAQFYQMQQQQEPNCALLSITEIGGGVEMQKIWHHYFLMAMGVVYCFDMSSRYEDLRRAFNLLQCALAHPHMRGKPVLVVGTKSDLANTGLHLYDIENAFSLEALASKYKCSLHMCFFGKPDADGGLQTNRTSDFVHSLYNGVNWLVWAINSNNKQAI